MSFSVIASDHRERSNPGRHEWLLDCFVSPSGFLAMTVRAATKKPARGGLEFAMTKEKGQEECWIYRAAIPGPMGEPGLPASRGYSKRKPGRLEQTGNKCEFFARRPFRLSIIILMNQ